MIICKDLNIENKITSLEEWFTKCPPQGKEKHWVDGRSAKETAKHWLNGIPVQLLEIVKPFGVDLLKCSPEFVTKFDSYTGNGRNHDLLIIAENQAKEKTVIAIESKVDESFDKNIIQYHKDIEKKKAKGENTNADKRVNELLNAILPDKENAVTDLIRYQLLTATAGALAEAKKQNAKTAIFLVQTYVTTESNKDKLEQNQKDLNYFINILTDGKNPAINDGDLVGPINVKGNNAQIDCEINLWIGKYSVKI